MRIILLLFVCLALTGCSLFSPGAAYREMLDQEVAVLRQQQMASEAEIQSAMAQQTELNNQIIATNDQLSKAITNLSSATDDTVKDALQSQVSVLTEQVTSLSSALESQKRRTAQNQVKIEETQRKAAEIAAQRNQAKIEQVQTNADNAREMFGTMLSWLMVGLGVPALGAGQKKGLAA